MDTRASHGPVPSYEAPTPVAASRRNSSRSPTVRVISPNPTVRSRVRKAAVQASCSAPRPSPAAVPTPGTRRPPSAPSRDSMSNPSLTTASERAGPAFRGARAVVPSLRNACSVARYDIRHAV